MKVVSGKRFCRLLEAKGWQLRRIHGSHYIYIFPGSSARISVPVHGNSDLKIGLQRQLMKMGGIGEDEL